MNLDESMCWGTFKTNDRIGEKERATWQNLIKIVGIRTAVLNSSYLLVCLPQGLQQESVREVFLNGAFVWCFTRFVKYNSFFWYTCKEIYSFSDCFKICFVRISKHIFLIFRTWAVSVFLSLKEFSCTLSKRLLCL